MEQDSFGGWDSALAEQQQSQQNAMFDEVTKAQKASYDEYAGMHANAVRDKAQRQLAMQNDAESLMRFAMENGGAVPQDMIGVFNRKFGFDGKTTGMLAANFDDKGNFVVNMDGQEQSTSPIGIWEIMNRNKVAFDDNMRSALRNGLTKMGYSDVELDRISGAFTPVGERTPSGGVSVPGEWLTGSTRTKGNISAFGADGNGGFSHTDYDRATGRYVRREYGRQDAAPPAMSEKERIALMQEQGRNDRAYMRDKSKRDIADLQAYLKERGYDIDEGRLNELINHHQANEQQQAVNEQGRNDRAQAQRDVDWAKIDQAAEKWKGQYEVAMKNAKTAEERAAITKKYNEGRLEIQNGRLDLEWAKLDETSSHNQVQEGQGQQKIDESVRHNQEQEGQSQQRIDESGRHNQVRESQSQQRIDNSAELAQKKLDQDRELKQQELDIKKQAVELRQRIDRGVGGRSGKEIDADKKKLDDAIKFINNGKSDVRATGHKMLQELAEKYKAPIKQGDNGSRPSAPNLSTMTREQKIEWLKKNK